jgi:hypothetical protein
MLEDILITMLLSSLVLSLYVPLLVCPRKSSFIISEIKRPKIMDSVAANKNLNRNPNSLTFNFVTNSPNGFYIIFF